jgi:hypothetical protein
MMRNLDELFAALAKSRFRAGCALNAKDRAYLNAKGLPTIVQHAADFVNQRLAPAEPARDGKQTPWRGHPVFVAQHATATCCRGCLSKWHNIPQGSELTSEQRAYVVGVIERWLASRLEPGNRQAQSLLDSASLEPARKPQSWTLPFMNEHDQDNQGHGGPHSANRATDVLRSPGQESVSFDDHGDGTGLPK